VNKRHWDFRRLLFALLILVLLLVAKIPSRVYLIINNSVERFKETEYCYVTMIENFTMKTYYEERKNELVKQVNSLNYNYNLLQEEIISTINLHCLRNNIAIDNFAFMDNDDVGENLGEDDSPLRVNRVSMEFKCSFDDLLRFIDDIKNDVVKVSVVRMRIINWKEDLVNVNIELNFYSLNHEAAI
jgi:hypothetical protein